MKIPLVIAALALSACAQLPPELPRVNASVNHGMAYLHVGGWYAPGDFGNCTSFVLAKGRTLEAQGLSPDRLAVVVYQSGPAEQHVVLLVDDEWAMDLYSDSVRLWNGVGDKMPWSVIRLNRSPQLHPKI